MTKSEKIELLINACDIGMVYYREKAQTEGISARDWLAYMELIDKYDRLYSDLLLVYFRDFAKENV